MPDPRSGCGGVWIAGKPEGDVGVVQGRDDPDRGPQRGDVGAHAAGPALTFTPTEWTAFTAGLRAGEFD